MNIERRPYFQGLRDLGYVVGRNLTVICRAANRREDAFVPAIREPVQLGVDVIFAFNHSVAMAARAATSSVKQEKAKAAALRIEQFVKEIEGQLWWTANAPWTPTKAGLEQRRLDFLKLQRRVPAITELRQLDQAGREQLRVSRVEIDVWES